MGVLGTDPDVQAQARGMLLPGPRLLKLITDHAGMGDIAGVAWLLSNVAIVRQANDPDYAQIPVSNPFTALTCLDIPHNMQFNLQEVLHRHKLRVCCLR